MLKIALNGGDAAGFTTSLTFFAHGSMVVICGPVCHISSLCDVGRGGSCSITGPVGLCSPPAFLSVSSATLTISVHTAALFRQDGRLPADLWLSSDHLHSDLGCARLCVCMCTCSSPCVLAPYLSFCFSLSFLAAVNCLAASGLLSSAQHLFQIFILSTNFVTIRVTQLCADYGLSLPALCCCLVTTKCGCSSKKNL